MGGKPSVPNDQLPAERTFIITGSNTGIGYETAKTIAQLGGRVIMACRNETKANDAMERMKQETNEDFKHKKSEIPELNIQFMELDLSSLESTIKFARQYKESGLPLHVLICNAGLLAPTKKSAPNSRIVNVSSLAHKYGEFKLDNIQGQKTYGNRKFYGNSKLFQIMNMHSLSRRLPDQQISIFSLHPGVVDTGLSRYQSGCFMCCINCLVCCAGKDTTDGSRTSLIATIDEKYTGKTALYFDGGKPSDTSGLARNKAKQEILWKYSLLCLKEKLDDVILAEIGEKLENIEPLD